jgi:hypothetical protein
MGMDVNNFRIYIIVNAIREWGIYIHIFVKWWTKEMQHSL